MVSLKCQEMVGQAFLTHNGTHKDVQKKGLV